jgi:hypothetical protein
VKALCVVLALALGGQAQAWELYHVLPKAVRCTNYVETTNHIRQSGSFCQAGDTILTPWAVSNATCTNDTATHTEGAVVITLDTCTASTTTGRCQQPATGLAVGVGPRTVSALARDPSGTGIHSVGMIVTGANPVSCSCRRSDLGACTVGTSGTTAYAYSTFGTTAVRLYLTCSMDAAVSATTGFVHGGQHFTNFAAGLFGGAQFEEGTGSPYIQTEATTVTRAAGCY